MFKQEEGYFPEGGDWYWLKAAAPLGAYNPLEPLNVDRAGKSTGCATCHLWKGNGDFMLTFNFGDQPVIRTRCVDDAGNDELCEELPFRGNENRPRLPSRMP